MSDLAAALMVAIRVHADQRDKQGEPYLLHVLRVVEAVSDEAKVVAALHDVLEDCSIKTMRRLEAELPWISAAETMALCILTRRCARGTYANYINRISCSELAREVKLADLRDNLERIPAQPAAHSGLGRRASSEAHSNWLAEWGALRTRYEKAILVLSAGSSATAEGDT
jgi:hypothetical protein